MKQTLDLARHGIDEAAGKTLLLNGCEYVLHPMSDEGGETFIFPLENTNSGLVQFLAKIYKFRPGSPEERRHSKETPFILQAVDIPCEHEEEYEIPGGILKFQLHKEGLFLGKGERKPTPLPVTESTHQELVDRARYLVDLYDRPGAIEILEEVLNRNPQHSLAMVMLAEIHETLRQPREVVRYTQRGLTVEPNDTRLSYMAVRAHIAMGQPSEALKVANDGLRRYEWDWGSWSLKREVATRFSMLDVLEEMDADIQTKMHSVHLVNDQIREKIASGFQERRGKLSAFHIETDKASDLTDAMSLIFEVVPVQDKDSGMRVEIVNGHGVFRIGTKWKDEVVPVQDKDSGMRVQIANGHAVFRIGTKWKDEWLGRSLRIIACIWFLNSMNYAELYDSTDEILQLVQRDSTEMAFSRGLSSIIWGEREKALDSFRTAAKLGGPNPFVLFGLVLCGRLSAGAKPIADEAMRTLEHDYGEHPISTLARRFRE